MDYSVGDYTPHERRLLELLDGSSELDTKQITEMLYAGRKAPEFARNSVVVSLNKLRRKVIRRRESFRIQKSRRSGSYPIRFWIERRPAA